MAFPKLLQRLFQNNGAGDKLNQDIIPDIPYSKVTDAPSVDSALSSTSENPVQNKVINSALDGKLSLLGGTMTGNISFNNSLVGIIKADKNGSLALSGGNTISSGGAGSAILFLAGGNDSSGFNAPGEFSLQASKGTYGQSGFSSHELRGKPDGTLTWGGRNVLTGNSAGLTVVAESYGANSWYRKYSDGWIEQGGRFDFSVGYNATVTKTFPIAFTNASSIFWLVDALPTGNTSRTDFLSFSYYDTDSSGDSSPVSYRGNAYVSVTATGMTAKGGKESNWRNPTFNIRYFVCGK